MNRKCRYCRRTVIAQSVTLLSGLLLAVTPGKAGEEGGESEPVGVETVETVDLTGGTSAAGEAPSPVASDDFSALRAGSPFLRVLDPAEKYVLRAVASLNDMQIATLQDRSSKKTILVTPEKENEEGLKLVEIVPGQDLEGVMAKINFAGQEVEFKYDSSQLFPAGSSASGRKGASSDGEDRRKGPSKEDIERYKALTDEKREKLRAYIGHVMKSYPDLSREERGNMIRGAMIRLTDGRDLEFRPVERDQR